MFRVGTELFETLAEAVVYAETVGGVVEARRERPFSVEKAGFAWEPIVTRRKRAARAG